jgi:hypothetical protein
MVSRGFKTNVPPQPSEWDKNGNFLRKSSHVIGNGVYHPTKGFRKLRAFNQHIVLNSSLAKIGLHPVQA